MQINNNPTDLGRIPNGNATHFTTTIVNDSEFPITITNVKAGCSSCTTASVTGAEIVPHGTSILRVKFKPNSSGVQHKMITIGYTENGVKKSEVFTFKANSF